MSALFQVMLLIFFAFASKMAIFMAEVALERELLIIKLLKMRPISNIEFDCLGKPNLQVNLYTNAST